MSANDRFIINRRGGDIIFQTPDDFGNLVDKFVIPASSDSSYVLSDGDVTIDGYLTVDGYLTQVRNLRVTEDLIVDGYQTIIETETQISDQVIINNAGTGPALDVNQSGTEPVATFKDDGTPILTIEDGGTVSITGLLSLSGGILADNGDVDIGSFSVPVNSFQAVSNGLAELRSKTSNAILKADAGQTRVEGGSSGGVRIDSDDTTIDSIALNSSGGIDIDAADGIAIDVGGTSNLSTTSGDINILNNSSAAGDRIRISAASPDPDSLRFTSSAGGMLVSAAQDVSISTSFGEIQLNGGLVDIGSGTYTFADGDKDFGIAGDLEVLGDGYFKEAKLVDSSSNWINLSTPSSVTSYDIIFPSAQATASGQILVNDGSGNLSWSAVDSSLQNSYETGNTINTTSTFGTITLTGTEKLLVNTDPGMEINSSSGLCLDANNSNGNGIRVISTGQAGDFESTGQSRTFIAENTNANNTNAVGLFKVRESTSGAECLELDNFGTGKGLTITSNHSGSTAPLLELQHTSTATPAYFRLLGATSGQMDMTVPASITNYSITWPSAQATAAGQVLKNDGTGILTWEDAGTGQGELTYISNPSFATDTSGWTTTGGMSATRTTTASELPREFLTETAGKVVASSATSGDYVAFDFDIDDVDKSKKLKIQWDQLQLPDSGNAYESGDFEVIVRDLDNGEDLTPVTTSIPAKDGTFITTFSSTNSQNYELRIRTTVADSDGLSISNVILGPGNVNKGAVITGEEDWSNRVTYVNDSGHNPSFARVFAWREGEHLKLRFEYEVTADGTDADTFGIQLPAGFTPDLLDNTGLGNGRANYHGNATKSGKGTVQAVWDTTSNSIQIWSLNEESGANIDGTEIGTSASTTYDRIYIPEMTIKILEWKDKGTVNQLQQDNVSEWLPIPESSVSNLTVNIEGEGGFYRKLGDSVEVMGSLEFSGSNTENSIQPIIPNNLTLDTSKVYTGFSGGADEIAIGSWYIRDTSGNFYGGPVLAQVGAGNILLGSPDGTYDTVDTSENDPIAVADGDIVCWRYTIPVVEFRGDQGTLAGFSDATSSHSGLVKKNRWQTKTLSSNIDSTDSNGELDGSNNATDLTFNNLVAGRVYEFRLQASIRARNGDDPDISPLHDGSIVGAIQAEGVDADEDNFTVSTSGIFEATTTTLTFNVSGIVDSNSAIVGGGNRETTYAQLIERNDLEPETNAFS